MKLSRRAATILLVIGVYMLLTWGTRVLTFLSEFRSGTLAAPGVHFTLVVIGLSIGIYLTYLGVKGRRATRRESRRRSGAAGSTPLRPE
jgi:threonine/homoserine/homoserine lactone efflux protein